MRATVVCVLLTFVLACVNANSDLIKNVIKQQPKYADANARLSEKKKVASIKAAEVSMKSVLTNGYQKCDLSSDCADHQECIDYVKLLADLTGDNTEVFGTVYKQIEAKNKRCKNTTVPKVEVESEDYTKIVKQSSVVLVDSYIKIHKMGLTLTPPKGMDDIEAYVDQLTKTFNTEQTVSTRTTEIGAGIDMNTFLLISLLDKDGSSSSLKDILPIMLMTQGGAGMGGDLLSNPLLLMSLLDDDKDSKTSDLLLIMTLMNGGGLGGSTDLLGSPLLLMTLLKDDSSSLTDLLPILVLSGGLGGGAAGGADLMSNPLLLLLLLDGDSNSTLDKLLPIILLGSMSASGSPAAGGMNSILPLLLLLDGNDTDISDLLLIMMVSGGGLGGAGGAAGGDMNALLPILLLGDKLGGGLNDTKDLLLISLLGGMGGAGGAGGAGGLQSILPFLLLSDSSALNGSDSLTLLLLLSGGLTGGAGAGGAAPDMNMLLPLLLDGGLGDSKDLLLIMMLGGMGGAGGAGAAGMQSMLPLLLLGNGTMDTTTLVLVMMMSQAQPGTVSPDGTVAPGSSLNMILPLLLAKDGGLGGSDDTLTMIMLLNMMSQGPAASAGLLG